MPDKRLGLVITELESFGRRVYLRQARERKRLRSQGESRREKLSGIPHDGHPSKERLSSRRQVKKIEWVRL